MKKRLAWILALSLAFHQSAFSSAIDSYDKLVVKMEGATTSFVDSSTGQAAKSITANGNATQLSLHADFAGQRTAGFFNGTTDYVTIPHSSDWAFGSGEFSIQFYVNFVVVPSGTSTAIFVTNRDSSSERSWSIEYVNGTGLCFSYTTDGSSVTSIDNAWTPSANTWYKIKAERVSNTLTIYIDGVAQATTGNLTGVTIYDSASSVAIARLEGVVAGNFWIKNLTITKAGTTVLDMKFDNPATSPLGPAIYFDGTGDYLSTTYSSSLDLGSTLTAEGWFRFKAVADAYNIFSTFSGATGYKMSVYPKNGGTGFINLLSDDGTTYQVTSLTFNLNKWYHLAWVVTGGKWYMYRDGLLLNAGGTSVSGKTFNCDSHDFYVGHAATGSSDAPMYLREARISNSARYSSAFTPSQTGFTADANTVLYLKGSESNGVTTFVDSETSPKTITTNGDTKINYIEDYRSCVFKDDSASAHKPYSQGYAKVDFFSAFGSGVGYFDGAGDYLAIADSADWDLGDFDVEFYLRPSSVSVTRGIIGRNGTVDAGWINLAWNNSTRNLEAAISGSSATIAWGLLNNTWHHLAITRSTATIRFFFNGILQSTTITDADALAPGGTIAIGNKDTDYWLGLMDNIRISKGVARYTDTFNPGGIEDASWSGYIPVSIT